MRNGLCLSLLMLSAAASAEALYSIALGSCLRQNQPQPIWEAILAVRPDLFIFLGDNVYADTMNMDVMRAQYAKLQAQSGYRKVRASCPVLATWDDHDYGQNDAGAEYRMKNQSQLLFLDFLGAPQTSPLRTRPGIYSAHSYGPRDQGVQVVLLDTRFFRSALRQTQDKSRCPTGRYVPNEDPAASLLGERQWRWLRQRLLEPALIRLIVSSIQVIPEQHCFEKWANFPRERERLFKLISDTHAQGVVFASGDRHFAEISRLLPATVGYPLYEITASGMNSAGAGEGEQNRYRITAQNFRQDNFGLLTIDWRQSDPLVSLQIRDVEGNVASEHRLQLSEITPAQQPARKVLHQPANR